MAKGGGDKPPVFVKEPQPPVMIRPSGYFSTLQPPMTIWRTEPKARPRRRRWNRNQSRTDWRCHTAGVLPPPTFTAESNIAGLAGASDARASRPVRLELAPRRRHAPAMRSFSVFDRKPSLSMLTAAQLLQLASEFRGMALTASTADCRQALNALAVRYVGLAAHREIEDRNAVGH